MAAIENELPLLCKAENDGIYNISLLYGQYRYTWLNLMNQANSACAALWLVADSRKAIGPRVGNPYALFGVSVTN